MQNILKPDWMLRKRIRSTLAMRELAIPTIIEVSDLGDATKRPSRLKRARAFSGMFSISGMGFFVLEGQ
jgi:hypothetical protein